MNDKDFAAWVSAHIAATGAEVARTTEVLWANREGIVSRWRASYAEMCECTQRLFEGGHVPQFPSEHPNALYRELRAMRAEKFRESETRRNSDPMTGPVRGCDCPSCNGGEIKPSYEQAMNRLALYLKEHGALTGGIGTGGSS